MNGVKMVHHVRKELERRFVYVLEYLKLSKRGIAPEKRGLVIQ